MPDGTSFELTYLLYASPEIVFDSLTKSGLIEKWSDGKARLEPVKGGTFEMFDGWVKGEILAFDPPAFLSLTWKTIEWSDRIQPSVVEFSLSNDPAGTSLHISHSGLPGQEEVDKHRDGWINFVLEPLNDFLIS